MTRTEARRRIALLGVFAVLLQAILFGWHHHELGPAARGAQPLTIAGNAADPGSPLTAEDDCDICAALHHLSNAPGEFVALKLPVLAEAMFYNPALVTVGPVSARSFQARAPPRV